MAFNLTKMGRPIARIEGGKLDKNKVYLSTEPNDNEYIKEFTNLELNNDSKFQQIPSDNNREILYIVGASGSGKTTYATNYIKELRKVKKDIPLYIFSTLQDDYKELEPNRIKMDEGLINDPIQAEELKDSIVIFDDVDCISDKNIKKSVWYTLTQCLEIGRHYNVYVVMTNHIACGGESTKKILNESYSITFFPQSGSSGNLMTLLKNHCGLSKKDIEKIKTLKTRWCTIYKHYPQCIMSERNLYLLHNS
jgi:hypothetical protein